MYDKRASHHTYALSPTSVKSRAKCRVFEDNWRKMSLHKSLSLLVWRARRRKKNKSTEETTHSNSAIALTFSPDVEQEHVARLRPLQVRVRLDTPLGIRAACSFSGLRVKGHGRGLRGTWQIKEIRLYLPDPCTCFWKYIKQKTVELYTPIDLSVKSLFPNKNTLKIEGYNSFNESFCHSALGKVNQKGFGPLSHRSVSPQAVFCAPVQVRNGRPGVLEVAGSFRSVRGVLL